MIFAFAEGEAMERSSSTLNGGFPSTCCLIEKPRPSKSGGFPIGVCRSSAGIAEVRGPMVPGKEHHKREPLADRWQRLSNLSETMKGFFREPSSTAQSP